MAKSTCAVDACDRPANGGRGWCGKHYMRWQRHGDPLVSKTASTGEPLVWLREAVAQPPSDRCIPWPFDAASGYGSLRLLDGVRVKASQAALILSGRPRPEPPNHYALHSCDNPPCVNPAHLRWGTQAENGEDMRVRDRSLRGERQHRARLTEAQVRDIRSRDYSRLGSKAEAAEEYGVSRSTVIAVLQGRSWKHLP